MAEQNVNKPVKKRAPRKKKESVLTLLKNATPEEIRALKEILDAAPTEDSSPAPALPELPRLNAAPPPVDNNLPRLDAGVPSQRTIRDALQQNSNLPGRQGVTKEVLGPRPNKFDNSPIKNQRKNLIKQDKANIGDNDPTPRQDAAQQYLIACESCGNSFPVYLNEVQYVEGVYRYKCNGCLGRLVR